METSDISMTEGKVWQGVNRLRRNPQYPVLIRMLAGLYHAILAFFLVVGALLLFAGRDAIIGLAQDAGWSIQASSSAGQGAVFLGAVLVFIGVVHGWAALCLFAGEHRYVYIIVVNLAWLLLHLFVLRLNDLGSWVQAAASLLIVGIFLFDDRLKAAYGRGRDGLKAWQRKEAIRLGKPLPSDEEFK